MKKLIACLLFAVGALFLGCPVVAPPAVVSTSVGVDTVSLDITSAVLRVGSTIQLSATLAPDTATDKTVAWTSSSGCASVAAGLVTGVSAGQAVITAASADGSRTASATITVGQDLVINEVVNSAWINYSYGVEIYNPTSQTVDLGRYSLRSHSVLNDGAAASPTWASGGIKTFKLPAITIAPGAYVALRAKAGSNFESGGSTVYVDDGAAPYPYMPSLTYTNDFVELLNNGSTADFVRWGSTWTTPLSSSFAFSSFAAGFPAGDPGIGYALARDVNSSFTRSAADWTLRAWSTLGGKNDVTSDADADSDGIPDAVEASGKTFAGLPLYDWGARPAQRDIFIHIDYMDSADPGITPQKAALDKVVAAFNAQGIKIHFDVGTLFSASVDPANYNLDGRSHKVAYAASVALGKATGYGNVYKYKVDNMPVAKSKAFFYMLFANSQKADGSGGSSGIANLPGNTSIITLGSWGLTTSPGNNLNSLINYQASTMMHEFGHNLGLRHGGDIDANYKPNYFSIMNYMYQLSGLPTTVASADTRYYKAYRQSMGDYDVALRPHGLNSAWLTKADSSTWTDGPTTSLFVINYSDKSGAAAAINEASASEAAGSWRTGSAAFDINMDGDVVDSGVSAPIRYYLDPNATDSASRSTLSDFNDWAVINSVFQRGYMGTFAGASQSTSDASAKSALVSILNDPNPTNSTPCATNPDAPVGPGKK